MWSHGYDNLYTDSCRHTSTEELFPTGNSAINSSTTLVAPPIRPAFGSDLLHTDHGASRGRGTEVGDEENIRDVILRERQQSEFDVSKWNTDLVVNWLHENGFSSIEGCFREQRVDGHLLQILSKTHS